MSSTEYTPRVHAPAQSEDCELVIRGVPQFVHWPTWTAGGAIRIPNILAPQKADVRKSATLWAPFAAARAGRHPWEKGDHGLRGATAVGLRCAP